VDVPVLFQDDQILVVHKPSGVAHHNDADTGVSVFSISFDTNRLPVGLLTPIVCTESTDWTASPRASSSWPKRPGRPKSSPRPGAKTASPNTTSAFRGIRPPRLNRDTCGDG
jgi:hypothetical protein